MSVEELKSGSPQIQSSVGQEMSKKYLSKDKLAGKQVIDTEGMIVGTVRDIVFDLEAKEMALTVGTVAGPEITISQSNVKGVGDVVLLATTVEIPKPPEPVAPVPPQPAAPPSTPSAIGEGVCPSCGLKYESYAKFCVRCGAKLK